MSFLKNVARTRHLSSLIKYHCFVSAGDAAASCSFCPTPSRTARLVLWPSGDNKSVKLASYARYGCLFVCPSAFACAVNSRTMEICFASARGDSVSVGDSILDSDCEINLVSCFNGDFSLSLFLY